MTVRQQAAFWIGALASAAGLPVAVQRHPAAVHRGRGARLSARSGGRQAAARRHEPLLGDDHHRARHDRPVCASRADRGPDPDEPVRRLRRESCPPMSRSFADSPISSFGAGSDVWSVRRRRAAASSRSSPRATAWIGTILGSVWAGGRAIINVVSLFVVTPVVAFYLLYDWDRMIAPLRQPAAARPRRHGPRPWPRRSTGRSPASSADRAQSASSSASSTRSAPDAGRPEFRVPDRLRRRADQLHPLRRLDRRLRPLGRRRAGPVLAGLALDRRGGSNLRLRPVPGGQHPAAAARRLQRRRASGLADVRAVRLRHPVRLCRPAARGAGDGRDRRPRPLCARRAIENSKLYRGESSSTLPPSDPRT